MSENKLKLLLVEDDLNLGTILREFLLVKEFEVDLVADGQAAVDKATDESYDLFILDVMLPKKDGFTIAEELRDMGIDDPVIFLTAKSMQEDKIAGFKAGADDYITKPFSTEELFLRISAILRRTNVKADDRAGTFLLGSFIFDPENNILLKDGAETKLTYKESELLKLLTLNKNSIVERSVALNKIWHDDNYFTSRSMDVYIAKLRNYLKEESRVEIRNIHGKGYKLVC